MSSKMEDFGFFLTRAFATTRRRKRKWPYVPGKYFVHNPGAPVAVTTLGSVELAEQVAESAPEGLCIVGKVETENIGIEKIIKNILSNPAICWLLCAGKEPPKHLTGATIIALFENGIDEQHRIIGSPGMRPVLPNTSEAEITAFRNRIKPVNMIGCTDVAQIHAKITELAVTMAAGIHEPFTSGSSQPEHIVARHFDPKQIVLDKAGYFVIHIEEKSLLVEHYDYHDQLLRTIEGDNARDIYLTIINNHWVSAHDHAAYLGAQLMKAEQSLKHQFDFVQDGA
jgi:tetrahydromethanopterin S-methyltransferase subunit A